jgi:hypothetical protein
VWFGFPFLVKRQLFPEEEFSAAMPRRERSARTTSSPRPSSTLPEVQQQCCTAIRKVSCKHMNAPEYQAATMLLQLGCSGRKTLIQQ